MVIATISVVIAVAIAILTTMVFTMNYLVIAFIGSKHAL